MEYSAVRAARDRISVLHLGWCDDTADRLTGHDRDVTFVVPDPDRLDDVVSGLPRAQRSPGI